MLRTALWKVMAAMASGLMTLRGVGSFSIEFDVKECMKRKEIGFREGNFYECPSPAYSDCCERDGQFTCCEPLVNKTIREQLMLWGSVACMALIGALLYHCLYRDSIFGGMQDLFRRLTRKRKGKSADAVDASLCPPEYTRKAHA